jgi:4-amino-4-deoxy-L-arabinose transferase-like glycosyltransferase
VHGDAQGQAGKAPKLSGGLAITFRSSDAGREPFVPVDALLLALILAAAVVTRLTYLDLVEFRDDEPRVAGLAVAMLQGRLLPLVGIPSSVGVNNPPAFVYLMLLPLAISRDPVAMAGFIGLLGVGAVLLCYRFCDEFFDRRTAQVAALLFASSPGAVVLTRKIQEQDVLPFFVLLWIGSLFHLIAGHGRAHLLGAALWLSALVELHLASVALVPVTALAVGYYWWKVERARIPWRWLGGALALTALLWLPYGLYQATHQLTDLRAALKVEREAPEVSIGDFQYVVDLVSANTFVEKTGSGAARYLAETISFAGLYSAERLLFFAAVAYAVARLAWTRGQARGDWRYAFLLVWLIVPPLVFVRHAMPLYIYYFLTVLPAPFVLIGLLVADGCRWLGRLAPRALPVAAASAVVGSLVASQVYGLITVMDFIGRESTLGSHGVPLREQERAMDQVVATAAGSSRPVYVAYPGPAYPLPFEYLAAGRIQLKSFDDNSTFVLPPSGPLLAGDRAGAAGSGLRLIRPSG